MNPIIPVAVDVIDRSYAGREPRYNPGHFLAWGVSWEEANFYGDTHAAAHYTAAVVLQPDGSIRLVNPVDLVVRSVLLPDGRHVLWPVTE